MTKTRRIARVEAKKVLSKQLETKFHDIHYHDTTGVSYAGTAYGLIDGINQGIGDNQVIGDRIRPVGIRIGWKASNASTGDNTQLFRIVVVQFKGVTSAPSASGIFQSTSNVEAPLSPYDAAYNDTFRVLYDKTFSMVAGTSTSTKTGVIKINQRQLRNLNITWDGSSPPAPLRYENGALYMFTISDSSVSSHPEFDYDSRVYYKDA